jgi:hypothetical protein
MAIAIGEIRSARALRWFIGVFLKVLFDGTLMDSISSVNDEILDLSR